MAFSYTAKIHWHVNFSGVYYLCRESFSVNQMFSAFLACLSPMKVKLRSAVLVWIRAAFQRYITDNCIIRQSWFLHAVTQTNLKTAKYI